MFYSRVDNGEAWVVSYWHLPGGYDAVHARAVYAFFENEDDAQAWTTKYANPPEMAVLMTRQQYEEAKRNARR